MPFSRLSNFARRTPDASGILALLGLVLAVFWPLLLGKALFFGDLELYYFPVSEFWRRQFSAGHLPLWNPQLFGGVSYVGNPQIVSLYPPDMLLWWLPTYTALGLSAILHLWGSASCFFLWMRRGQLQLGAGAALLGAMCWMLGGAFVTKTQFPNMLSSLAYLPAAMWASEVLARRPGVRVAAALGAILALQLLAAHAQISFLTIYFALIYTLWVWKSRTAPRASLVKVALGWAFALGLAALLDAGQLLPVAETLRGAERQVLSLKEAQRFILPVWAITHLFAPYLYGNPSNGTWTYMGGGNSWETACYLGILPFLLALWAWKKGQFWSVSALVCLVLAMGTPGGLYLLAYYFVPGISRFHNASRFLMLGGLAFSILAALGFQKLQGTTRTSRFALLVLIICALDLGIYARTFYPLRDKSALVYPAPKFITDDPMLRNNQGRLWCSNPKTARGLFIHYENYTLRTPAYDALFPVGSIPDTHIWSGLLEAEGYDPIAPAIVAARLKALEIPPQVTEFTAGYASKLGDANIRLLALWRKNSLPPSAELGEIYRGTQTVDGLRLSIYRNEACLPRARFLTTYGFEKAALVAPDSNSLQIKVPPSGLNSRQLEIADNYAPGWRAYEDGAKVPLRSTAGGFMQIDLKPKARKREVRLVYEPESYRLGVFIMLCALGLTVGLFWATKKPETK